jgi:hypothetical protein
MTTQDTSIPDVYEFTDGETHITYSLSEDATPSVDYHDAQESQLFVDTDVRRQDSELGTLISVSLKRTVDSGATILTILLPPIDMAGKKEQHFHTVAIRTQSFGMLPHEGARLTYHTLQLHGVAKLVPLPGE